MHRIRSIARIVVAILLTLPGAGTSARAGNPDVSITAGPLLEGSVYRDNPDCVSNVAWVNFNVELATRAGVLVVTTDCGVIHKVFPPGSCALHPESSWIVCLANIFDQDEYNDEFALITSRLPIREFAMQLWPPGDGWTVYSATVTGIS